MSKFGLYGKILTHPGQREALVAILLEAAAGMPDVPGCDLYIINVSPTEPDAIWVTEVWAGPGGPGGAAPRRGGAGAVGGGRAAHGGRGGHGGGAPGRQGPVPGVGGEGTFRGARGDKVM